MATSPGKSSSNSETEAPAKAVTVVTLASPMSVGTLHDPADRFPDITYEGTALTEAQATAARQVAKELNFRFRVMADDGTEEVDNA